MEFFDLAPGDPISQDGSLREFRYSQLSQCPSAPFNTAESECIPSQFHISPSVAASPLPESEHVLNDGTLGEPPTSSLCSLNSDAFDKGVQFIPKCGEHLGPGTSYSDSLGLSLFDAHPDSEERESSPRRIYCDARILEEETQVSDVGVSVSAQQDSPLLSGIQHSHRPIYCDPRILEEETQVFDDVGVAVSTQQDSPLLSPIQHLQSAPQTNAIEPEKSLPLLSVIQECHAAVEDFADISRRWHNRRKALAATAILSSSASPGLPSETNLEIIKPSTSNALDADHFRRQPTVVEPENASPLTATNPKILAVVDNFDSLHNRKRIALSAYTNLSSSSNTDLHKKLKQTPDKAVESGALQSRDHQDQLVKSAFLNDKENWTDSISPTGSETIEADANVNDDTHDSCDSKLPRRILNYSCTKDLKSFLQPRTARQEPVLDTSGAKEQDVPTPEQEKEKWACPRKSRRVRQRTVDAWIK